MRSSWITGLILLVLLVAFRCLGAAFAEQLPGFSPLPAFFLCSVVFFRGKQAWLLPLGAWLLSNPIATMIQGYNPIEQWAPVLTAFLTLLALGFLALPLRKHANVPTMLGAGLVAAILFHLVTGVAAWLSYPLYPKDLTGLFQSLWSGPAGAEIPSWAFLRNLAAANLLFTGLFLAARHVWLPASESKSAAVLSAR
ncbi:DUF6580 family putative transport protein [Haloferula sp.]|uniref:DUF6580 family putative transport protein n=1 Tax=Haloferula sp. TaxID=2497595 RepID=UPI00329F0C34